MRNRRPPFVVVLSAALAASLVGCIQDPAEMEVDEPAANPTNEADPTGCDDNRTRCGPPDTPVCADLTTDDRHCGICDNDCTELVEANEQLDDRVEASCQTGRCVLECPGEGTRLCGDSCIDVDSAPRHCGRCGVECTTGSCNDGRCEPAECDPDAALTDTGSGESDNPYTICSTDQLDELRDEADAEVHVVLADDLVFELVEVNDGEDEETERREHFEPIEEFNGTLRGDGFEIRHFTTAERDESTGLVVENTGEISDLTLTDVDVRGGDDTGALAAINQGTVTDVTVHGGSVRGDESVGGLLGYNRSRVSGAELQEIEVEARDGRAGGLAGRNEAAITDSHADATVIGHGDQVGGLVGRQREQASVNTSSASGRVVGHARRIGGLVGDSRNGSEIIGSEATGDVGATGLHDDTVKVGGLVGRNRASITDSLATGAVRAAGDRAGGLVGEFRDDDGCEITDSYAAGDVVSTGGNLDFGGLVGRIEDDCDLEDVTASGDVTAPGVGDVGGLVGIAVHDSSLEDATARGDVDAGERVGGLVGRVESPGAELERCRAGGEVSGTAETGGLVGRLNGTVDTCRATGDATAGDRTGGLVGRVPADGAEIEQSLALGAATGADYVGGLIGAVEASGAEISDVYALGDATGFRAVGGLVGTLAGEVDQSYSAGSVSGTEQIGGLIGDPQGAVDDSYWDRQTSGLYDHRRLEEEAEAGEPLYTDQFDNRDDHFDSWPEVTWRIPTAEELTELVGDRHHVRPHLQWEGLDD